MCTIAHVCKQFNLNKGLHNRIKWVMKAMETCSIYKANNQHNPPPPPKKTKKWVWWFTSPAPLSDGDKPFWTPIKETIKYCSIEAKDQTHILCNLAIMISVHQLEGFLILWLLSGELLPREFPILVFVVALKQHIHFFSDQINQTIKQQNDQSINLSRRSSLIFRYANSYPARHTPI